MERWFEQLANVVALCLECASVLLIAWGGLRAAIMIVTLPTKDIQSSPRTAKGRSIFVMLGRFLLLGLEFTLAADVVRTAIAPSWNDIGKLAAIAAIRTFLAYFLERDVEHFAAHDGERAVANAEPAPAAQST